MQSFEALKERHRAVRENLPENLSLRIHRSLSWMQCAEQQDNDDAKFIFLWIAFNAAYSHEIDDRQRFRERRVLLNFIRLILDADKDAWIDEFVWAEFSNSIRLLIANKYVFQPFWDHQTGKLDDEAWQTEFLAAQKKANQALGRQDTVKILAIIFDRLYTLRNQLIHGGATWNSRVNRVQIRDGICFLYQMVAIINSIMLEHQPRILGQPCYPVVG